MSRCTFKALCEEVKYMNALLDKHNYGYALVAVSGKGYRALDIIDVSTGKTPITLCTGTPSECLDAGLLFTYRTTAELVQEKLAYASTELLNTSKELADTKEQLRKQHIKMEEIRTALLEVRQQLKDAKLLVELFEPVEE